MSASVSSDVTRRRRSPGRRVLPEAGREDERKVLWGDPVNLTLAVHFLKGGPQPMGVHVPSSKRSN